MKWLGLLLYLLPGKRTDADFSVMCLPRKPGGRLLEIGCGSGTMLEYIGSLGWEVEGADVDSSAVVNARKKGLKVSHGSIEELCYGENTFDAITISHVIEHVPDPVRLISECFRILKPGGTLSLVTPNTESFGLSVFSESWLSLDPPRHLMLFNVKTIRQLARSAGFSDVQAKTTIREVHSLVWASYSISRHGYFAFGSVPPKCVRFILLLVRLIVYGGVKIFPNKGEEISLMAIK
jgi:SAM-dependent methyltransferase